MEINNKEWLARDQWDATEAACFFEQIEIQAYRKINFFGYILIHPKAQKNLEIIKTWAPYADPFWYINKAIEKGFPEITEITVNAIREYIEGRLPDNRNKFLQDYPYIVCKLSLSVINQADNSPIEPKSIDKAKYPYPWVFYAIEVYYQLGLDKIHLNKEQKAKKIEKEMIHRLSQGQKEMALKRGRKAPSSLTILKHALKYI